MLYDKEYPDNIPVAWLAVNIYVFLASDAAIAVAPSGYTWALSRMSKISMPRKKSSVVTWSNMDCFILYPSFIKPSNGWPVIGLNVYIIPSPVF